MVDRPETLRGTVVSILSTDHHPSYEPIFLLGVNGCLIEKNYPQPGFTSPLSYWITGEQVEYITEIT